MPAPALSAYDQTGPLRQQPTNDFLSNVRDVPHNEAKHSYEEPKLSSLSSGRTFEHSSTERDVAKEVATALVVDFGHYRSTHKTIASIAGASPETVKRWVAADSAPSLVFFLRLLPHSPSLRRLVAMESELSPDFTRELNDLIRRHIR